MKDKIIGVVKKSFDELKRKDGSLFECPIEEEMEYDSRKLHEVCINHKLSNYLEKFFFQEFPNDKGNLFFDIEFNREGGNRKELEIEGRIETVRPDIILHNRKSGDHKINLLVVECKKKGADSGKLLEDEKKIKAFITSEKYKYQYGLQVIYGQAEILGYLYYLTSNGIEKKEITSD